MQQEYCDEVAQIAWKWYPAVPDSLDHLCNHNILMDRSLTFARWTCSWRSYLCMWHMYAGMWVDCFLFLQTLESSSVSAYFSPWHTQLCLWGCIYIRWHDPFCITHWYVWASFAQQGATSPWVQTDAAGKDYWCHRFFQVKHVTTIFSFWSPAPFV